MYREYVQQRRRRLLNNNGANVDRKWPKVFTDPPSDIPSLMGQRVQEADERPLYFWRKWDGRRAQVLAQSLGPRNLLEEQIDWTKKGMMWPYPIDNEYMSGQEEGASWGGGVGIASLTIRGFRSVSWTTCFLSLNWQSTSCQTQPQSLILWNWS